MVSRSGCCAIEMGVPVCGRPAEVGSPLNLCSVHLLAAYDWVARGVGVTDLLPSPCRVWVVARRSIPGRLAVCDLRVEGR
jgi:hypothetical protein